MWKAKLFNVKKIIYENIVVIGKYLIEKPIVEIIHDRFDQVILRISETQGEQMCIVCICTSDNLLVGVK